MLAIKMRIILHHSRKLITRKIPIISPGLIFVQKAFLLGLFSVELIFGGSYYARNFVFQNGLGLTKKKLPKTL